MKRLTRRQAELIALLLTGRSVTEAAAMMGITQSGASHLIKRAGIPFSMFQRRPPVRVSQVAVACASADTRSPLDDLIEREEVGKFRW